MGTTRRRVLTVTGLLLGGLIVLAVSPLLFPLAALIDTIRGKRLASARTLAFLFAYFYHTFGGLLGALSTTLRHGSDSSAQREADWALQRWWGQGLFRALCWLYGISVEVEGLGAVPTGPLLIFARHTSTADTVLPIALIAGPRGGRPRYVLKDALRYEPCMDIVGGRLPNVFVVRGGGAAEVARVGQLAAGMSDGDLAVIYPEGTRFTPKSRAAALERLADDPERAAFAAALQCSLPPRHGGPLAMLANAPNASVVFLAHTGFEGATGPMDFFNGVLVGARVRLRFEVVPPAEVPPEPERAAWLDRRWAALDAWCAERLNAR